LHSIFPEQTFDPEAMLDAQALAAEDFANEQEAEAKGPGVENRRARMFAFAKAHRDFAAYSRSLSRDLLPYLVKGQVGFEGTGGFSVSLKGSQISVHHSSLGHSNPDVDTVALVIFVEKEIDGVQTRVSVAE